MEQNGIIEATEAQFEAWKASNRPLYVGSMNYTCGGADWVSDNLNDIQLWALEQIEIFKQNKEIAESLVIRIVMPTVQHRAELESFEHFFDFDWEDEDLYTFFRTMFAVRFKDLDDLMSFPLKTVEFAETVVKDHLKTTIINALVGADKDVLWCDDEDCFWIFLWGDGEAFDIPLSQIAFKNGITIFIWEDLCGTIREEDTLIEILEDNPSQADYIYECLEWGPIYELTNPRFIPEMVDLGLPSGLKWAKCNIGASKETDYGLYFKHGEVVGHTSNELDHFVHGYPETFADTATAVYGEGYRMPTREDFEELKRHTSRSIETIDGVPGIKFVSHADSSKYIFISFAGNCYDGSFRNAGSYAYMWSSTACDYSKDMAYYLLLCDQSGYAVMYDDERHCGFSVRAVSE